MTTHDISARLRSLADTMQTLACDMAAVGMGRGEWPEHSLELHNAGTMARAWAVAIELEGEQPTAPTASQAPTKPQAPSPQQRSRQSA